MRWYITELCNVATEIDGAPWGLGGAELTLVATLSEEVQREVEAEASGTESGGIVDDGLREASAHFDRLMAEAEKTGGAVSLSLDDLQKIDDERRAAEEAGWTPLDVEPEEDQVGRLSDAQLATARRVVAEASELYRRVVRTLQHQVADQEELQSGETWDDEEELEDIYEPEYDDAPVGDLFDEPEELDDEEYEPGWDEDDKPFEDRFSISELEIPFDDPDRLIVYGSCDWDPEHGFELTI